MIRHDETDATTDGSTDETNTYPSRRRLLTSAGGVAAALAGCSGRGPEGTAVGTETASSTATLDASDSPTATPSPREVLATLDSARADIGRAFEEIQTTELVAFPRRAWMPEYRKLGNMDIDRVRDHLEAARSALQKANQTIETETVLSTEVELLSQIATVAELGSEFYRTFALTFEKVYQYEYLLQRKRDYARGVEKMGVAREKLTEWQPKIAEISDAVQTVADFQETLDGSESSVPSFDREKWAYIASTGGELAHRFEPQLVAFESYAESLGADLDGLDELEDDNYQSALRKFDVARSKIMQATRRFEEADERGPSFFEPRATAYRNRVTEIYDGITLHVRATNQYLKGNTEKGGDFQFEGTAKIRVTIAENPVEDEPNETESP